jgi:hypothetical protein
MLCRSDLISAEFCGILHSLIPWKSVFSYTEFRITLDLEETIYYSPFFANNTEVKFKNINFAYVYLNYLFGNHLCLKIEAIFKKLKI